MPKVIVLTKLHESVRQWKLRKWNILLKSLLECLMTPGCRRRILLSAVHQVRWGKLYKKCISWCNKGFRTSQEQQEKHCLCERKHKKRNNNRNRNNKNNLQMKRTEQNELSQSVFRGCVPITHHILFIVSILYWDSLSTLLHIPYVLNKGSPPGADWPTTRSFTTDMYCLHSEKQGYSVKKHANKQVLTWKWKFVTRTGSLK